MNHFIIVVADQPESKNSLARDIYKDLMLQSIWGFGEKTQNIKKISVGDKLVFYLAGKYGKFFVGTAEVATLPTRTGRDEYRSNHWFHLLKVHVWDEPEPIKKYLSDLEFIKRPEVFGTYLQGGSRLISKNDYLTIVSPVFDEMINAGNEELSEEKSETPTNKESLLQDAKAYVSNKESHTISNSPHRVRIESKRQKKIIAELEDHACQICNWSLEWTSSKGNKCYRIDIDHIIDKADKGGEELSNLWALCPNCHVKKTLGVIVVDIAKKKIYERGQEIFLHHDSHLQW